METFYFTYGLEGYPFVGGWTEIVTSDEKTAKTIFRAFHPNKYEGVLSCASFYREKEFLRTKMFKEGNFGARCHEKIVFTQQEGPFDE